MQFRVARIFHLTKKRLHLFFIGLLAPVLVFSFQNCEPTALSGFGGVAARETSQESGGGNGEPYDGKIKWSRLVPGLSCANQNIAIGSLEVLSDSAIVISNANSCTGKATTVALTDLEYSTFSERYIGYGDGVYTRLHDLNDSISRGTFTEAWCRAISDDGTTSSHEFAVEWEEQDRVSRIWHYHKGDRNPSSAVAFREINVDRVGYTTQKLGLQINFAAKVPGSAKVPGRFSGEVAGVNQSFSVDCLMGGQFDPVAPKFELTGFSSRTLALNETLSGLRPVLNKPAVKFSLTGTLPLGLSFDDRTGEISGRPSAVSPRQRLKVSADFAFGSVTQDLSIAVATTTTVADTKALRAAVALANSQSPSPMIIRIAAPALSLEGRNLPVTGDLVVQGATDARSELRAGGLSNHFEVTGYGHLELNHLKLTGGSAVKGASTSVVYSSLMVVDSVFELNHARVEGDGGAIYSLGSNVEIYDSEFLANTAFNNGSGGGGGAIYAESGKISVSRSKFKRNRSMKGGAIYSIFGSVVHLRVSESSFEENYSVAGGAISSVHSSPSVHASNFRLNESTFDGGAISIMGADRGWITNSTFDGNIGAGFGSAAVFWSGNNWGGFLGMYSALYILDSEFQNHRSSSPAAVILSHTGELILRGTKLYRNTNLKNCVGFVNSSPPIRSLGGNMSDDGTCPQ